MQIVVPKLNVYYIDFNEEETKQSIKKIQETVESPDFQAKAGKVIEKVAAGLKLAPKAAPQVALAAYLIGIGAINLKRLADENRFFVIKNEEELKQYKNAYNNEWVKHNKALKTRQYYIQHPKATKSNILIEAEAFYKYIEEEMRQEILDYVQSHCPVKSLTFYKEETTDKEAKAFVKLMDANGKHARNKGELISFRGAKGIIKESTIEEYVWLEDSIKLGIRALEDGTGTFQKSFESDETFGLTAKEAKALGLDMKGHKKFKYTLKVEC